MQPIAAENHFPWYIDAADTTNIDCQCGQPCDGMAGWATHITKETTVSFIEHAQKFGDAFSSENLATDLGDKLTCDEVEALAGMLRVLGATSAAATWIERHAVGDECEDMHCCCVDCEKQ